MDSVSWPGIALAAVLGRALWPLVEYGVHGGLSHGWRTPVSPLHWAHHVEPQRVFTSPLAWVPIVLALFAVLQLAVGAALAAGFVSGLLAGFLRYEYLHWRIHFRAPRSERERRRRAHHLAHHECNPSAYYGVTTDRFDRVFGTLGRDPERDYAAVADRPPLRVRSNFGTLLPRRPDA